MPCLLKAPEIVLLKKEKKKENENPLKLMLGLHSSRKTQHNPVECNSGDIICDKYRDTQ